MPRLLLISFLLLCAVGARAQQAELWGKLSSLFFGIAVQNDSMTLAAAFKDHPQYRLDTIYEQRVLSKNGFDHTIGELGMYYFSFHESPLAGLPLQQGKIMLTCHLQQQHVMSTICRFSFDNKKEALKYFDALDDLFAPLMAKRQLEKFWYGRMIHFSTQRYLFTDLMDLYITFKRSSETRKFEVDVSWHKGFRGS